MKARHIILTLKVILDVIMTFLLIAFVAMAIALSSTANILWAVGMTAILGYGLRIHIRDWVYLARAGEHRALYRAIEQWLNHADSGHYVTPDGQTILTVRRTLRFLPPILMRVEHNDFDLPEVDNEHGAVSYTNYITSADKYPIVYRIPEESRFTLNHDGDLEHVDEPRMRIRELPKYIKSFERASRAGRNHASPDELRQLITELNTAQPAPEPT